MSIDVIISFHFIYCNRKTKRKYLTTNLTMCSLNFSIQKGKWLYKFIVFILHITNKNTKLLAFAVTFYHLFAKKITFHCIEISHKNKNYVFDSIFHVKPMYFNFSIPFNTHNSRCQKITQ